MPSIPHRARGLVLVGCVMLTWQTTRAATSRPAVVLALVAGLLLTGCSHASSTIAATPARTNGSVIEDAAPFCSFLTSVDEAAAQAASQKQGIRLLASIVPRLRARQAATPAPVVAVFGVVLTASEQAVAKGNPGPLATDRVAAAGTKLTNYCHARS